MCCDQSCRTSMAWHDGGWYHITRERRVANAHTIQNHATFIWSVADLLRGDYKQSESARVVRPITVPRWLVDRVLADPSLACEHEA